MKRSLGVYIRKWRQQRHVRTKTFADNSDDYGKCIFSLINRTAKFIRKKIACEFGCFCFLRFCKNSRAPPLSVLNIQKISIRKKEIILCIVQMPGIIELSILL